MVHAVLLWLLQLLARRLLQPMRPMLIVVTVFRLLVPLVELPQRLLKRPWLLPRTLPVRVLLPPRVPL